MTASPDLLPPNGYGAVRMDSGQGVWKRTGGKEFASTFVARAYDASGQSTNMIKINASFRMTDKDSIERNGKLWFCDLNLFSPFA